MSDPIYAHVPSLPAGEKKASGWPKGKPRKPAPIPVNTEPGEPSCAGCVRPLAALTIELATELVRVARDRHIESGASVTTDLLYLAARIDGFCSVGCWRVHGASPEQVKKLDMEGR